jgi:hypothetical protein
LNPVDPKPERNQVSTVSLYSEYLVSKFAIKWVNLCRYGVVAGFLIEFLSIDWRYGWHFSRFLFYSSQNTN